MFQIFKCMSPLPPLPIHPLSHLHSTPPSECHLHYVHHITSISHHWKLQENNVDLFWTNICFNVLFWESRISHNNRNTPHGTLKCWEMSR